jgi:hypothetical protein
MSTKEEREHIELLQGTLDLLILRTLLLEPRRGQAIAKPIEFNSEEVLQVEQGRCIQRCTGSSSADGSRWKAELRRTTAGP